MCVCVRERENTVEKECVWVSIILYTKINNCSGKKNLPLLRHFRRIVFTFTFGKQVKLDNKHMV